MQYLLDPTGELEPIFKKPLEKITATPNVTVGLIDISKAKGNIFWIGSKSFLSKKGCKPNDTKNLHLHDQHQSNLVQKITSEVDVVVQALAD